MDINEAKIKSKLLSTINSPITLSVFGFLSFFLGIFAFIKKGFYHNGLFLGSDKSYIFYSIMLFFISVLLFISAYKEIKNKKRAHKDRNAQP
jgi:hypothetical protein